MAFNLRRFNPFGDVSRFDFNRDIDGFFKEFNMSPSWSNFDVEPRIKVDISESDSAYFVKAEIPGVRKEDIKVTIDGNHVSISAQTTKEKEDKKGDTVVRSERFFGQQSRTFTLSCDVDDTKSQAKYLDGVLELTLPKLTATAAKSLAIS